MILCYCLVMDNKQQNILEAIAKVVKEEIRPVEERLTDSITKFKNEILTSNDKLSRKLSHIETEMAAFTGGQQRQDGEITGLKNRAQRVEAKVGLI